ncbi:MAG TPA: bifunctional molybdenum cofactor biosynthesis protein MoaC/MoaB [Candidatus Limnocylindria bacterium]
MKPSHLGEGGEARMVDVGDKPITARRAVARAVVRMRPDVLATMLEAGGPKGDAIGVARLAGIGAAKRTADLIPLCHPLPLDRVAVELKPDRDAGTVTIRAEVAATARTGVEMEALTAASIAALTLYDMTKALQRDISIETVELVEKQGGQRGAWSREPAPVRTTAAHEAVVVVCSSRSAAGKREDTAGPELVRMLTGAGWEVDAEPRVVPDDEAEIATLLAGLVEDGHRLIITTGGTGLTPTDVTPAATRRVIDREVPGMAELMRGAGLASTPMAALSRGVVGARQATLIANLPGSPKGAAESLAALLPVLRHAVEQLAGGDH